MAIQCYRCNRPVNDLSDSVRELEYEMNCDLIGPSAAAKAEQAGPARDCHIFKAHGCQGSPSRAQYLGGPMDTYEKYKYDPEFEPIIKAAWERCKKKAKKMDTVVKGFSTPALPPVAKDGP